MPSIVLTYFDSRGRAEAARWVLAVAGVEYEDKRTGGEDWQKLKPSTPTGQLPMLTVDGVNIAQSGAIAHYLAAKYGLNGSNDIEAAQVHMVWDCISDVIAKIIKVKFNKDPEEQAKLTKEFKEEEAPKFLAVLKTMLGGRDWLVGDKMTLADIAIGQFLSDPAMGELLTEALEKEPVVAQLVKKITEQPAIKAWIEKRPQTQF